MLDKPCNENELEGEISLSPAESIVSQDDSPQKLSHSPRKPHHLPAAVRRWRGRLDEKEIRIACRRLTYQGYKCWDCPRKGIRMYVVWDTFRHPKVMDWRGINLVCGYCMEIVCLHCKKIIADGRKFCSVVCANRHQMQGRRLRKYWANRSINHLG